MALERQDIYGLQREQPNECGPSLWCDQRQETFVNIGLFQATTN